MQQKYRIAILGIGGVGGFLGGKLAAAYAQSTEVEIIFIARGSNVQAMRENGLKLITADGEIVARPDVITDGSSPIGNIDLFICCTKAYDLESSIKAISSSVTSDTLILPILNGVDNTEKLQLLLPGAKVLDGCIYLVSKIIAPGIVQQRGEFYSVHFGGSKALAGEMNKLLEIFQQANINAVMEENILAKIWAKFSFISPIATYTSAYNISIGRILESSEDTMAIKKLMAELLMLANKLNIDLPADSVEKNFAVMAKLPYEATSSMQADFAGNKQTELETLTGYVVRSAKEHGVKVEAYERVYELLRERSQQPV